MLAHSPLSASPVHWKEMYEKSLIARTASTKSGFSVMQMVTLPSASVAWQKANLTTPPAPSSGIFRQVQQEFCGQLFCVVIVG
jgi:hypothetical protein